MPGDVYPKFRVAAAQAASLFLDRDGTLGKVEEFVGKAASANADLVVFGESFIPAFPLWNLLHRPVDQHGFFRRLYDNAVQIPGPDFERLSETARENHIFLSIGLTEKSPLSTGTMWNTNLLFDPAGKLLNRHRKLVPTWAEKLSWANGDGSGLRVSETRLGRIGALICGENTNPLARFALLAQGEQIHIATYPPAWPFNTDTSRDYNLTEAIRIRSAAHAFEGKVFNIVASCALDEEAVEEVAGGDTSIKSLLKAAPPSASMIIGPTGDLLTNPLVGKEGLVIADIDLAESITWKQIHDITGGYNRFDIFNLQVNLQQQTPLQEKEAKGAPEAERKEQAAEGRVDEAQMRLDKPRRIEVEASA